MLYYTGLILIPYLLVLNIISYKGRKSYDTAHSIIHYALILGLTSEILIRLTAITHKNNLPIYHLINFCEFIIFLAFYYKFLHSNMGKKLVIFAFISFLIILYIELVTNGIFAIPWISVLIKNLILVILSVITHYYILNTTNSLIITDNSDFWINISILIYYSCTLFIFGLRKYTLTLPNFTLVTIFLHLFFILVFYGLLSIGLWKTFKK